jgi:uncharacterized protein YkwD
MSTPKNFGRSSLAQAVPINTTQTLSDRLNSSNQADTFRLSVSEPMRFSLKGKSSGQSTQIQLISDTNQNGLVDRGEVLKSFSLRKGKAQQGSLGVSALAAGTYFIQVANGQRTSGKPGATSYRLSLEAIQKTSQQLGTTLNPTPSNSNDFISRVVDLTNAFRGKNGLAPLKLNSKLAAVAQTYSQTMATQDFMAHQGLDGSQPWDRMTAGGYKWSRAAENIAAGQKTPEEVMHDWINSPGHRANLLDPKLKEIGVGYYFLANDTGNVNYNSYWTQDFGSPQ